MKFKFKIQQYQTDAVDSTVAVFAGQPNVQGFQYRRDVGKNVYNTQKDDTYSLLSDTGFTSNSSLNDSGYKNHPIQLSSNEA